MAEIAAIEEVVQEEAPAFSEEEQMAYDSGWRPEAEFTGEANTWIDAKEFNGRKPLYDGLSKQSKRIKALEGVVKTLADQTKKADAAALEKAKAQLKAQRAQAHRDEDYDKAVELEDEQRAVEAKIAETEAPEEAPEFIEWRESNEWYGSNIDASLFADAYAQKLRDMEPNLAPAEFFKKVEDHVKKAMPQEFGGKLPNRGNEPGAVGTGRRSAKGATYAMLSTDQKAVCRELVNKKLFTQDEYVKQLDDMGEIARG